LVTISKDHFQRRGVALIVAISVLAILTILFVGLAASQQQARQTQVTGDTRTQVRRIARTGLDAAEAHLGRFNQATISPPSLDLDYPVDQGICHVFTRAVSPDDPVFSSGFLVHRPGDLVIQVRAALSEDPRAPGIQQTYLVNLQAAHPRCVRIEETLGPLTVSAATEEEGNG